MVVNQMTSLDKSVIQQRFAKARETYTVQAVAQQQICEHLAQLMQQFCPEQLPRIFEIGCGSGTLTRLLQQQFAVQHYVVNDLYAEVMEFFPEQQVEFCIGDAEKLAFPDTLAAVVSSSALQWMQDLSAVFAKIHAALNSQGWLCFSTFGSKNLWQIKQLIGQGLDYYSLEQLQDLLQQQGFEVVHAEQELIELEFAQPRDVLKHLKATGVTATNRDFAWTKQRLQQFYVDYAQLKSAQSQQQYPLTYHPIYIIARRLT
ncbi:malonyl-ACP O-methyltransferase BioC [Acinetobacter sp. ANC 5502]